jgi:hypothetical protein
VRHRFSFSYIDLIKFAAVNTEKNRKNRKPFYATTFNKATVLKVSFGG